MGKLGETTVARWEPGGEGSNGNGGENGHGGSGNGGFTKLPHWYGDHALTRLTEAEKDVLTVIFRQTVGRGRDRGPIRRKLLLETTGLSRRHLARVVQDLEAKRLITRYEQLSEAGDLDVTWYAVASAWDWERYPERRKGGRPKGWRKSPGGDTQVTTPQASEGGSVSHQVVTPKSPPGDTQVTTGGDTQVTTSCLGGGDTQVTTMHERTCIRTTSSKNSDEGLASLASMLSAGGEGNGGGVSPAPPLPGECPPDPPDLEMVAPEGETAAIRESAGACPSRLAELTLAVAEGGWGFDEPAVESLARKYGWERIEATMDFGRPWKGQMRNPAGWLTGSVRAGKPLPISTPETGKKGGSASSPGAGDEYTPRADDRGRYEETRRRLAAERDAPEITPESILQGLIFQRDELLRMGEPKRAAVWQEKIDTHRASMEGSQ